MLRYGSDGTKLLKAARDVVSKSPGLRDYRNATGLGDQPLVVETLLERVRSGQREPISAARFVAALSRKGRGRG